MNAQADRRDCRGIQETLSVTAGAVPPLPEGEAPGIIVGAGFHPARLFGRARRPSPTICEARCAEQRHVGRSVYDAPFAECRKRHSLQGAKVTLTVKRNGFIRSLQHLIRQNLRFCHLPLKGKAMSGSGFSCNLAEFGV